MDKSSPQKHFVCQHQGCSNLCNDRVITHCGTVCIRHHYGYGRHYTCEKCGVVRRRRNGHRVYTCQKCNHLYCYSCCFK
ncbi:unnamed protein product [Adineta steineri]|uniref:Uncharacterized protein n=1 Tax=Adineta steineri TaxID=433720 RepID=A0A818UGA0_9BILA|nr:unnamed protein product [Adineta steineri]CAF3697627.1 unnamed protein product [Adineta steineri]